MIMITNPHHQLPYPSIPITCMLLPYPALIQSTLRYQRPSPREPSAPPCFPTLFPLTLLCFSPNHFRSLNPSLNPSPLTFLRHLSFLLIITTLFLYLLYPRALFTREVGGIISACISINGPRSSVPFTVSNVSYCISSHSSYPHRHLIKLFSPLLS